MLLFPYFSGSIVFIFALHFLELRVMRPGSATGPDGRRYLMAHFVINGEFQNGQRNERLIQAGMNPDQFLS